MIRGSESDRETSKCLFIGNLPYSFKEVDGKLLIDIVSEILEPFGKLETCAVPMDRITGKNKGYIHHNSDLLLFHLRIAVMLKRPRRVMTKKPWRAASCELIGILAATRKIKVVEIDEKGHRGDKIRVNEPVAENRPSHQGDRFRQAGGTRLNEPAAENLQSQQGDRYRLADIIHAIGPKRGKFLRPIGALFLLEDHRQRGQLIVIKCQEGANLGRYLLAGGLKFRFHLAVRSHHYLHLEGTSHRTPEWIYHHDAWQLILVVAQAIRGTNVIKRSWIMTGCTIAFMNLEYRAWSPLLLHIAACA